jgi:DNA mismatch repair protein MutL
MAKIRKLDEAMVGLIAAGEVVEGPWSVVKELLENSLDAGASRLGVSVDGGGFNEIRVTDDGCGMEAADVALAFERYATSKVSRPEDLDAVGTLGFRGEALPAIAAVSRVTVYTRTAADATGVKALVAEGAVTCAPEGAPLGTTVVVSDLFYNVPARRKFAGQPASEWRRAAEAFKRLALAQLRPTFSLRKDRRLQYTASGGADARQRLGDLLGWELLDRLVPVAAANGAYALEAYLSPAAMTYGTTANIYTIVNGRPARGKPVFKAVMSAYEGRLERGRYPLAVVYLTLPREEVDVNVHPRKEEVRFAAEGAVFDFVARALREALAQAGVAVRAASFAAPPPAPYAAAEAPAVTAEIREAVEGYLERRGLWPGPRGPRAPVKPDVKAGAAPARARAFGGFGRDEAVEVLGQLDNTYIIVRRGRDLVVVDQHTAHERVLYDRLVKAGGGAGRQELLLPVTVSPGPAAAADLRACLPALNELGFEVDDFGGDTFLVRSHPNDLPVGGLGEFLAGVAADFAEEGRPAADVRREAVLKSVACHGAVKAGTRLEADEMAALVGDLFASAAPDVCPHGRPTMVNLAARELERLFRRGGESEKKPRP